MNDVQNAGQFLPLRKESASTKVVRLLKACGKQKDLVKGCKVHEYVREHRFLEKNCHVASTLVSMYARCGALAKAQQVLNELPVRSAVTWNALITEYVRHGQSEQALKCFDSMQQEGHSPDDVTLMCALKACGSIGAFVKGEMIHGMLAASDLLERNIALGNILVDMYARCGALAKAQKVLDDLPVRDAIMWTTLITGYIGQGQGEEALTCFDCMQCEGHSPDVVAYICALKACGRIGAAARGEQIHDEIVLSGMLDKDVALGNTLVDMYARCGALAKAQQALKELPVSNAITWNALISGYVQHDKMEEALQCFDSMQLEGQSPDSVTFIYALRACGYIGAATRGEKIHDKIVNLGILKKNILLGNTLVEMYARCGELTKARQVLDEFPARDSIMWNTLIGGYVLQGQAEEALKCFQSMLSEGHSPDAFTFMYALKACGSIGEAANGEQIHETMASLGLLERDILLGGPLVEMYAKCNALGKAQWVLDELPFRDVIAWNALIAGYTEQGHYEEAVKCFDTLKCEGHCPDGLTFICTLKACGVIRAAEKGETIHIEIASLGILEKDVMLATTLVDMYARCGRLGKAQQVLKELSIRDVGTWNALIAGYVQEGYNEEALKCFNILQNESHSPDAITFICALKACGSIGAVAQGEKIHDTIITLGMLEKNALLGGALVDMYARCGALAKAQQVLDMLPVQDVVVWNSLIRGYIDRGYAEEALECFGRMEREDLTPDAATFVCALRACGTMGAAMNGEQIHEKLVSLGLLGKDILLGGTLVDMYAKCAALATAVKVLEELPVLNVVLWNALIGGYALQGLTDDTLSCFRIMQSKGVLPDSTSLICLLNAFSHSGLLDQAGLFFLTMGIEYEITLTVEHFCCMVDLFGRAGQLNRALRVIGMMPTADHLPVWLSLLGACRKWGEVEIGELAFEHALHLDKNIASVHVCMANIYTAAVDKVDLMNTASECDLFLV